MDYKTYKRSTSKQLEGRKVVSRREMRNGYAVLPAGTVFTIEHKSKGLHLLSDPCPTCGVKVPISRVQPIDVDFLST